MTRDETHSATAAMRGRTVRLVTHSTYFSVCISVPHTGTIFRGSE